MHYPAAKLCTASFFLYVIFGYFSVSGQNLTPVFSESLKLYGYQDAGGKLKIPFRYEKASPFFYEEAAIVYQKGKAFFISPKGKALHKHSFEDLGNSGKTEGDIERPKNARAVFKQNALWGISNIHGIALVPPIYSYIKHFNGFSGVAGIAEGEDVGKEKIISAEKESIVFDRVEILWEGKYKAYKTVDGKPVVFYVSETDLTPTEVDRLEKISENCYAMSNDGLWRALLETPYGDSTTAPFLKSIKQLNGKTQLQSFSEFIFYDAAKNQKGASIFADSVQNPQAGYFVAYRNGDRFLYADDFSARAYRLYPEDTLLPTPNYKGQSIILKKGKKHGILGKTPKEVSPLKFDALFLERPGVFRALEGNDEVFLNMEGKELRRFPKGEIGVWSSGRYLLKTPNGFEYLNGEFTKAFDGLFKEARSFKEGFAPIKKGKYWGIIDTLGLQVISPLFDNTEVISAQSFIYHENGRWGTVKPDGRSVFSTVKETKYQIMPNGFVMIFSGKKQGLINFRGRLVLPAEYDSISQVFPDSLVNTLRKGVRGFMDVKSYEIPTDSMFLALEAYGDHSEGFVPAQIYGQWGLVDYMGRLRVPNQFEAIMPLSEEYSAMMLGGMWGFVSRYEELKIQPHYVSVSPFKKGGTIVKDEKGMFLLLNKEGEMIAPQPCQTIISNAHGNWLFKDASGLWGLISEIGKKTIYPRYDRIDDLGNGWAIVRKDGKAGLDKTDNFRLLLPVYDDILFMPQDKVFLLKKNAM